MYKTKTQNLELNNNNKGGVCEKKKKKRVVRPADANTNIVVFNIK